MKFKIMVLMLLCAILEILIRDSKYSNGYAKHLIENAGTLISELNGTPED